jgi:hypothetical protein
MNFVPSCARRVFDIAEALCLAVGNAIRPGFIQAAMALLVVRRIQRVRGLLLALEERFLAGRLVTHPARGVAARDPVLAVRVRRVADVVFPRRFGWLCGLVPGEAACFAGQLRVVLAEPGMAALMESCPQAVRIVRPLCWMLGIARRDFVPGDCVPEAVAVSGRDADAATRPAPVAAVLDVGSQMALVTAGMGWVRLNPG